MNTGWDLVDAVQAKSLDVGTIKDEDLPKDMKGMNAEQRVNYVNVKGKERAELQAKVQQLNEQRNKYVAEQTAKQQGSQTLGSAVKQAIREQAGKKHYTFKPVQAPSDANQPISHKLTTTHTLRAVHFSCQPASRHTGHPRRVARRLWARVRHREARALPPAV